MPPIPPPVWVIDIAILFWQIPDAVVDVTEFIVVH
jgi:hypothetical protein